MKDMGRTIFVHDEEAREIISAWSKEYFGDHVKTTMTFYEGTWFVKLKGLVPADFGAFAALYHENHELGHLEARLSFKVKEETLLGPDQIGRILATIVYEKTNIPVFGEISFAWNGICLSEQTIESAPEIPESKKEG